MRDVEELLEDPQLRAEAARIRDRARGAREDYKRHSIPPDPKTLKEMVADPIRELRDRVAEEIRRRESPDSLVPIDRDPVPRASPKGPPLLRTTGVRQMITTTTLVFGAPQWALAALALGVVAAVSLLWSYGRAPVRPRVKILAALLKGVGFAALVLALVEPLLTGTMPAKGPTPSSSWPTTARACSSRTTRPVPPEATGSAIGSRKNPPGRPGSARISMSATTPSTPTSGRSRPSMLSPSTATARRSILP